MSIDLSAEQRHVTFSQDRMAARDSADAIRHYIFPEGTVLFQKGDPRECAFLIEKGSVHIYGNDDDGEEKRLCVLGEGEIFGEMALVDNTARTATAITSGEAEIYIIPRNALQERITGLDPIVSLLLSLLIDRYRVTRIHMPESIKQEGIGKFMKEMNQHEHMPEEILRLRNMEVQRDNAVKQIKLEQELREAIDNSEFVPVLQPIVNIQTQKIVGFEALIRWHHPEKGLIMPFDFIAAAERTGIIKDIDEMMLDKACTLLPSLQKKASGRADKPLFVSANLSGMNFADLDIVDRVAAIFEKHKINPAHIKLEITESALVNDPELAEQALHGLKKLGAIIALDDFGTGYSSLGYLHKFPIDLLKIDRSFIAGMHEGPKSLDIVKAIIVLARTFDLDIVAEGIEEERDVKALQKMDCDMGQGYYFARPLSVEDAYAFIDANLSA